jgi:ABC-2 type transport system ATP-binding protein
MENNCMAVQGVRDQVSNDQKEVILRTIGLTKKFGKRTAVNNLNLEIRQGEVFGFLGPNGSGKSTTVSMIVGLIAPTSGHINAFGLDLKENYWAIMRKVGATIETPAFYPYLSGWDNLDLFSIAIGGIAPSKIKEVLEKVNLLDRAKDKYKHYSLGMKQRLAIASALLRDPELIILDEPTNGLDPAGYKEVRDLIPNLTSENRTIILCSHLLNEVEKVCNRVAIIKEGNVLACESVRALLSQGQMLQIKVENQQQAMAILKDLEWIKGITPDGDYLLVDASREDSQRISKILAENNIFISELTVRSSSLESIFLELTGSDNNVKVN